MQLLNNSPFRAERLVNIDKSGAEILVLLVKATYDFSDATCQPTVAKNQLEFEFSEAYWATPGASSVYYESDAAGNKLATDVILIGHAHNTQFAPYVDVALRAGELLKLARVFGNRHWQILMGKPRISRAMPFKKLPLRYEYAFGGKDTSHPDTKYHQYEPRNPVGVGFRARNSRLPIENSKLPNIESPYRLIENPLQRLEPIGFGFVAKNWVPRTHFQGTYDEKWSKTTMPLLPDDFDERFHNAASPGLMADGFFAGGESIKIKNATPSGYASFSVPKLQIDGSVMIGAKIVPILLNLDTVIINTDVFKLVLIWRGKHNVHGVIEDVRWVRVECGLPINE